MQNLFEIYSFIFGTLIGSFLNVVILRLPTGKKLVLERSACPSCQNQLAWYHNIPLFSFLFLRGKCSFCKTKISWRYPLIEVFTGFISYWLFPETLSVESLGLYLFYFSTACVFLCHFVIDIEHQLLLDNLNLYLLAMFLPFAYFNYPWAYWVIGGALGFGMPLSITWLFYKLRGQVGLGGGDIKLFGLLGIILGPLGVIFNIFLSCFLGSLIGGALILSKRLSKDTPMAFGPAIILVAAFQIFFPDYAKFIQELMF